MACLFSAIGQYYSKKKSSILLLIFLPLLFSIFVNTAIASNEANDVSSEEHLALKNKTVWEILSTSKSMETAVTLIVIKLKDESVSEGLTKLYETCLYTWPSFAITGNYKLHPVIPVPVDGDRIDVLQIINNRRVVKLIQGMPLLPKNQAAGLINQEIEVSLVEYDQLYNSYFQKSLKYYNSIKSNTAGKAILLPLPSYNVDGTPTLKGLRYKILALVLIAGNLELQESQSAVQKVIDYAIRQRDELYNIDTYEEKFASLMLTLVCLYNRQILGTAVLGTYVEPDKTEQVLRDTDNKFQTRKLKQYDQVPAVHQLSIRSLVLLDDVKGQVNVKYVEALSDSKFDALVTAANNARQQSGHNSRTNCCL